jgi:methionine-rich copper-binding protein CopC
MRAAVSGVVVGLFVLLAGVVGFPQAEAQRPTGQSAVASAPDLMALSFDAGEGRQQITVVDPRQRVLAVYHVDRATGALSLKSVRHLQWDLLIEDYNSDKPTPREVHSLVQPKQ